MTTLLIVEDEDAMATALRDGFEYEGYDIRRVADGERALQEIRTDPPDLVILDVMLPRLSGLDVCRTLRAEGMKVPIILLTARAQEIDRVLGLKIGADDYVTKPFSFMELAARVEAVLRRAQPERYTERQQTFGEVAVDFEAGEVRRGDRVVPLTPRELRLLEFFVQHRGRVLSRETLLSAVWDYTSAPLTRTVDMHIAKLRRKIERRPDRPELIVTVHRVGYRFVG